MSIHGFSSRTSRVVTLSSSVALALGLSFCAACAEHIPPVELTNARAEMVRAKQSAMQLAPAKVHDAELALQKAEQAFSSEPDDPSTIDLAIVAQLRAKQAETEAATLAAQATKAEATLQMQKTQTQMLASSQSALQNTQGDLSKTREQLEREKKETDAQRTGRMEAERKLKDAQDTLSKIANVKEDDRGLVITFQGEVLFKTGQSTLLPAAMVKLDQVAEQLRGQERKLVVLGHTDNQGGAGAYNQTLSEKRATAVRDYLVSKGIPQDLVSAEGKGPSMPVSDNSSIEGRSANRRVEIIVQPKR
jgi:outer membrane protein OmpA-like peptidoglycan-associated protein